MYKYVINFVMSVWFTECFYLFEYFSNCAILSQSKFIAYLFLQNKMYIHRGKEYERLSDFSARLQTMFPNAEVRQRNKFCRFKGICFKIKFFFL